MNGRAARPSAHARPRGSMNGWAPGRQCACSPPFYEWGRRGARGGRARPWPRCGLFYEWRAAAAPAPRPPPAPGGNGGAGGHRPLPAAPSPRLHPPGGDAGWLGVGAVPPPWALLPLPVGVCPLPRGRAAALRGGEGASGAGSSRGRARVLRCRRPLPCPRTCLAPFAAVPARPSFCLCAAACVFGWR